MHQHRKPSSALACADQLRRPVPDSRPYRALQCVSPGQPPFGNRFEIIRNKDQMDGAALIERSDELPHAVVGIGFQYVDTSDLPGRASQHGHFGELRQVACRLKQPESPFRRSPLDHESPDRSAYRGGKHYRRAALESNQRPSFQHRMSHRLCGEHVRILALDDKRAECAGSDPDRRQLVVTETDMPSRLTHP